MNEIQTGRLTVSSDHHIVVLLIGARINRWWLLPLSLPILSKMSRMVAELSSDPESGLLGVQNLGLGSAVQYWKSYEHLHRYANDSQKIHRPTWTKYYQKLFKNQAIGIWHETYLVSSGQYESIYSNMPKHGLGRFLELVPASGLRNTATERLGRASAPTSVHA